MGQEPALTLAEMEGAEMAYYADLTPYTYPYGRTEGPNVVNVGWLSKDAPFPVGDVPADFAARLAQLVLNPVRVFHGSHTCEFCPDIREGSRRLTPDGNGEIRVPGDGGVIYVAPVLVAHYVTVHRYQPPQAFIDAVLRVALILVSRPGMRQESELGMTFAESEVTEVPFPYLRWSRSFAALENRTSGGLRLDRF